MVFYLKQIKYLLELSELKHHDPKDTSQQALLQGLIQKVRLIVYNDIDKQLIKQAVTKTKEGSEP